MSYFIQVWEWIKGLFVEPLSDAKPAPAPTPAAPEVVADADTQKAERRKDIDFTAQAIAKHAEHYEMHQQDLYVDWSQNPDLFVEACFHVNWPAVVRQYSDKTMHRVLGSGTNFNFKGRDSLRQLITAAIKAESAWRAPDAPGSHGMAEDGGQK